MTELVLFHHVQGLTGGVREFAAGLRGGGHVVHTPDLFEGATAPSLQEGLALVRSTGREVLRERADAAVAGLPGEVVYGGFSWGAAIAQRLTQTRPGALGALLYEACLPVTGEDAFGPWPPGAAAQIHGMEGDEFFAGDGDLDAARELVATIGPDRGQLFLYPGDGHLFTDSSLPAYDAGATALVLTRSRDFLETVTR